MGIEIEEPELVIGELIKLAEDGEVTITRRHLRDLLAVVTTLEQEKAALMTMLETLTEGVEEEEDVDPLVDLLRQTMTPYQQPQPFQYNPPAGGAWTISNNVNVDVADYVESLTKRADEAFYDKYNKF